MTPAKFNEIILKNYNEYGRHDMPWRKSRDPYRIFVSEIMLQQTQVSRARPFYENFIKRFPGFEALAEAKTSDVLGAWQGLGYNRRAIALQKASKIISEKFHGKLPRIREDLESLPGVGRGTSGSLLAFAYNEPVIFIETNIRRVFLHFFFSKGKMVTDAEIERYIERTIDVKKPREWYWALMDYGAMLPRRENPNRRSAHYAKQSKFIGSDRELRGKVLRFLLAERKASLSQIAQKFDESPNRVKKIGNALLKEGFLGINNGLYCISK